ncbi:hypothetical protein [Defluviimonas sp. WL0075]|uniref:DUF732 domain-containing protein n=1 Tax=Albidovulum sediminicola TaxID=2984331 RepID=A0ABT2Z0X1_9RHOB|nr:hypothetical protein [Defluviimonas sp. WL0075]MCV2864795.1 hypothetical protein [Defluviimonas sp. WL0075]
MVIMSAEKAAKFLSLAAALSVLGMTDARASLPDRAWDDQGLELLCQRSALSSAEIDALRKSDQFVDIIEFTLQFCPNVAAVLTEGATGAVTSAPPPKAGD